MSDDGPFRTAAKVRDAEIPDRWVPAVAVLIAAALTGGFILGHVCADTDPVAPSAEPAPLVRCRAVCETYGLRLVYAHEHFFGVSCTCGDALRSLHSYSDGSVAITNLLPETCP